MLRLEIQGLGPSALALGQMLLREGWQGDLGDLYPREDIQANRTEDPLQHRAIGQRSLALSAGSLQLIKRCTGALPKGADITSVEVQIGARSASQVGYGLMMRNEELGLERLGRVVVWSDLVEHLKVKLNPRNKAQQVIDHHQARVFTERASAQADPWCIRVWADGDPGSEVLEEDPQQSAIIGRVYLSGAPRGWALERFLPDGPLALLPDQQNQAMQLVWCSKQVLSESRFEALKHPMSSESEMAMCRALNMALPKGIVVTGFDKDMHCVKLKRRARAEILRIRPETREVDIWIANAAQSLHPVAGQGLNLGLRDAAELARCLVDLQQSIRHCERLPSGTLIAALKRFEQQRQRDRWLMMQITDQLAKQSSRFWFQALAPHALKLATQAQLKRLIMQTFAFGPREPWPLLH
jgi:2-octaprenyl-6-methoxyphenol hydroxylase